MSDQRVVVIFRGKGPRDVEVRSILLEDLRSISLSPTTPSEKSVQVLACSDMAHLTEEELRNRMVKEPTEIFAIGPQNDSERERKNWDSLFVHFHKSGRFVAFA